MAYCHFPEPFIFLVKYALVNYFKLISLSISVFPVFFFH